MCVYTCTCVWDLWGDDMEATGWLQTLILRHSPSRLVRQDPLLAWSSPVRRGQLAWAPGLCLPLSSQCRDHKTAPWHPAFVYGFYGSNLAPHNAGTASTLPTELSPQPQDTPFMQGTAIRPVGFSGKQTHMPLSVELLAVLGTVGIVLMTLWFVHGGVQ